MTNVFLFFVVNFGVLPKEKFFLLLCKYSFGILNFVKCVSSFPFVSAMASFVEEEKGDKWNLKPKVTTISTNTVKRLYKK